jgi:hypothetical protein
MRDRSPERRGIRPGVILVAIGVAALLSRYHLFDGPGAIVFALGIVFLAVSAARAFSGPLLPGGILTGLGGALLLQHRLEGRLPFWGIVVLGLGAGFLFVAAVDLAKRRERRPSPLLPGLILVVLGALAWLERTRSFAWMRRVDVGELWPWAVVAAGLLLVGRTLLARGRSGQ